VFRRGPPVAVRGRPPAVPYATGAFARRDPPSPCAGGAPAPEFVIYNVKARSAWQARRTASSAWRERPAPLVTTSGRTRAERRMAHPWGRAGPASRRERKATGAREPDTGESPWVIIRAPTVGALLAAGAERPIGPAALGAVRSGGPGPGTAGSTSPPGRSRGDQLGGADVRGGAPAIRRDAVTLTGAAGADRPVTRPPSTFTGGRCNRSPAARRQDSAQHRGEEGR